MKNGKTWIESKQQNRKECSFFCSINLNARNTVSNIIMALFLAKFFAQCKIMVHLDEIY